MCIVFQDTCSENGLCVEDIKAGVADAPVEPPPDIPPVIEVLTPELGDGDTDIGTVLKATVNVRQYQRYATCKVDAATGDKIAPEAGAYTRSRWELNFSNSRTES